ncbi:MAG: hypothetical protein ACFFE2_09595 [Candidatus Thorarchaeota archaeon]
MTEGPVRIGSFLSYQIAIFLLVFIWTIIGFQVAQIHLVPLYEDPLRWITWSAFVFVSIIPIITPVTWRMKTQVVFIEPVWDFRKREVTLQEYENMMNQYRSEYRNYLSVIDIRLLLIACIIPFFAMFAPFLLMRSTILLIAATPIIFGVFVLLFGLVYSAMIFKFIPNEATPHFPITSSNKLDPVVEILQQTPGISWVGISVKLGEASGFYTIRDTTPVSRIEGIESVGMLRGEYDDLGEISRVVASLILDDTKSPKVTGESSDLTSVKRMSELVLATLEEYIEMKGEDELLDEVIEEVTHFMKRFENKDEI